MASVMETPGMNAVTTIWPLVKSAVDVLRSRSKFTPPTVAVGAVTVAELVAETERMWILPVSALESKV